MNNFTLDDIDYLVVSGRTRYDNSGEYDISYYENYINENIIIIEELIKNVQSEINMIKDENIKGRIQNWSRYLTQAYETNKNKQPRIEYEKSPYSKSLGAGYFQTHKYADFIQHDFHNVAQSYSKIINFMNNIYKHATISDKKGEVDSRILYDIFAITKKACSSLGIHCPDALSIYESITGDPYAEKSELLDMNFEIEETNSLEQDVLITSLPYTITAPSFTWEGPSKYELQVTNPRAEIWYNQSYLQNNPTFK